MPFGVIQSSRETAFGSTAMPWALLYRAEIATDFAMCVLMTIEVSLGSFAFSARGTRKWSTMRAIWRLICWSVNFSCRSIPKPFLISHNWLDIPKIAPSTNFSTKGGVSPLYRTLILYGHWTAMDIFFHNNLGKVQEREYLKLTWVGPEIFLSQGSGHMKTHSFAVRPSLGVLWLQVHMNLLAWRFLGENMAR
jgi:hypothetical protein